MCLIAVAHAGRDDYPLIVAANRDELYARPTEPAHFWSSGMLAGRDVESGGTWLGVTRTGRFAAVTNFRGAPTVQTPVSRGALVANFLQGHLDAAQYLEQVAAESDRYQGFNLLVRDAGRLMYFSNQSGEPRQLEPGVYGLSNALLNSDWPKVYRVKQAFAEMLAAPSPSFDELFALLGDESVPDDDYLPDTGVGVELERRLAPVFIRTDEYGTRCSTILVQHADGRIEFAERERSPGAAQVTRRFEIMSVAPAHSVPGN